MEGDLKMMMSSLQWFEGQDSDFYRRGIADLPKRWNKCINLKGDYVEK